MPLFESSVRAPRSRSTHALFAALLLAISFSTELSGQTTTSGGLTGVVTDPSHAFVAGVQIAITAQSKGTTQSTKTDHEGVYRFFFLEPGKYTLMVTCDGFRQESRTVHVLLGPPVSVNVPLSIAEARTEVTVTEEAPLLRAENGDASATMNQHVKSPFLFMIQCDPLSWTWLSNREPFLTGRIKLLCLALLLPHCLYVNVGRDFQALRAATIPKQPSVLSIRI